jgi:quinol-cytochrome oxidoreductase complex cytochrome b subunit
MTPAPISVFLATAMRDLPNGRWLRIAHANGASLFFIVVYVHTIRAFYYSSWSAPNEAVRLLGIALLLLMITVFGSLLVLPLLLFVVLLAWWSFSPELACAGAAPSWWSVAFFLGSIATSPSSGG